MATITATTDAQQVTDWILNKGYVVCGYPRRGEVVVNGFKRYAADKTTCQAVKAAYSIKHKQ